MITIVGGKWTTTRHMAEETIDALSQIIHKTSTCTTKEMLLTGSNEKKGKLSIDEICGVLRKEYDLPRDICLHLATTYGYKAYQVWKSLGKRRTSRWLTSPSRRTSRIAWVWTIPTLKLKWCMVSARNMFVQWRITWPEEAVWPSWTVKWPLSVWIECMTWSRRRFHGLLMKLKYVAGCCFYV